jgi:hypothetical protein
MSGTPEHYEMAQLGVFELGFRQWRAQGKLQKTI